MPSARKPITGIADFCARAASGHAAAVGNEDGAHHVAAELLQALLEVGFSAPPGGVTYWVGEAMGSVNYIDLKETPKGLVPLHSDYDSLA